MSIFSRSPTPMLLLDDRRTVVECNPALLSWVECDAERLVGQRYDSYLEPAEWASIDAEWRDLLRAGSTTAARTFVTPAGVHVRVRYAAELIPRRRVLWMALGVAAQAPARGLPGNADPSPRELEVIAQLAGGHCTREIADKLCVAPRTVDTHVRNAMRKVGARSRAQLVAKALSRGLLNAGDPLRSA